MLYFKNLSYCVSCENPHTSPKSLFIYLGAAKTLLVNLLSWSMTSFVRLIVDLLLQVFQVPWQALAKSCPEMENQGEKLSIYSIAKQCS